MTTTDAGDWGASCPLCGTNFERDTQSAALAAAQACAENDRRGSDYYAGTDLEDGGIVMSKLLHQLFAIAARQDTNP